MKQYLMITGLISLAATPAFAQGTPCTMEAMMCPDGSAVGREGPDCKFKACPGADASMSEASQQISVSDALAQAAALKGKNFVIKGKVVTNLHGKLTLADENDASKTIDITLEASDPNIYGPQETVKIPAVVTGTDEGLDFKRKD